MNNTLLIVGAFIIAVTFMMLIANYQVSSSQVMTSTFFDARNHSISETIRLLLRQDIAKIARGTNLNTAAIKSATKGGITFEADMDNNGSVETVKMYLESIYQSPYSNKNIKSFVTEIDGTKNYMEFAGITALEFYYFDQNGRPTSTISNIQFVGFKARIETTEKIKDDFQFIVIEDRVLPKSIFSF